MEIFDHTEREAPFAPEKTTPDIDDAEEFVEAESPDEDAEAQTTYLVKFNHFGTLVSPQGNKFRPGIWYTLDAEEYESVRKRSSRYIAEVKEV